MFVIGTAGHVDHGKSTLVHALTGIDPDRLAEEKTRGLTIDLGFAWLALPDGSEVSIVDVPGHEKFVSNMLAGVGGIDVAMLVVAADESVMPQTREHLAIIDLLGVDRGLAVVTKKDLVDEEMLELVVSEVDDLLADTSLGGAPIFSVSAENRDGFPELIAGIGSVLADTNANRDIGRPRLPVDRAFTISGFGSVITGTLRDGVLETGQDVELLPQGTSCRIRSLQSHQNKEELVRPGNRVAVNLAGISMQQINRGDVLTIPGWLKTTEAIDVRLNVITEAPRSIKHNMFVTFHTGASEVVARLRLLETELANPGDSVLAQLKLEKPLPIVKGDYFIVRSNRSTLGGGTVIDAHAPRHRRRHDSVLEKLLVMEAGSDREILIRTVATSEPIEFVELINEANMEAKSAASELEEMVKDGQIVVLGTGSIDQGDFIFTTDGVSSIAAIALQFVQSYHSEYPLRKGVPKEELRSRLNMTSQVFTQALPILKKISSLVEQGSLVRVSDHKPKLNVDQQQLVDDYLTSLDESPYSPPTSLQLDADLLTILEDGQRIVQVGDLVVFSASAYDEMKDRIISHLGKNGTITVAEVRDLFDTSRKYALAILEHLDKNRITRRVDDKRILRE